MKIKTLPSLKFHFHLYFPSHQSPKEEIVNIESGLVVVEEVAAASQQHATTKNPKTTCSAESCVSMSDIFSGHEILLPKIKNKNLV